MEKISTNNLTNEEILKELDNIYGTKECREMLYNYATFLNLKKNELIKLGTYNIIIKNSEDHEMSEKLVNLIHKLLTANSIIKTSYKYVTPKELRKQLEGENDEDDDDEDEDNDKKSKNRKKAQNNSKNAKTKKEIVEEILVFDNKRYEYRFRSEKDILKLIKKYPRKIFILIDGEKYRDWEMGMFENLITWEFEVNEFSKEDKEKYITSFLKENKLSIEKSAAFINKLSTKQYEEIKSDLLNIVIQAKSKNVKKITDRFIQQEIKNLHLGKLKNNKTIENPQKELEEMIGIQAVKKQVSQIINYIKVNKQKGNLPMLHMCFQGRPGTGKTTVARILGELFAQEKILSENGKFVEVHGRDLIAKFVGWTSDLVKRKIKEAEGGVLFIDEAYSLNPGDKHGFEDEAIATLLKEMEDKRDNICVILAGYTDEMNDLLKSNPGFDSRIQFKIDFPDYTDDELYEIFKLMAKAEDYKISPNVKNILIEIFQKERKQETFANARTVRNLFEKVKFEQADRVVSENDPQINLIKKLDIEEVIKNLYVVKKVEKRKIGFYY